jgi:hypothetical protein
MATHVAQCTAVGVLEREASIALAMASKDQEVPAGTIPEQRALCDKGSRPD